MPEKAREQDFHKELKGVYDYISSVQDGNNKLFNSFSQEMAALTVQGQNTSASVKELTETVKAQGKLPIWQIVGAILSGAGVVGMMMYAFLGKPLDEAKLAIMELEAKYSDHEQLTSGINSGQKVELGYVSRDLLKVSDELNERAKWIGGANERFASLSEAMRFSDRINTERDEALRSLVEQQREITAAATANRYTKEDAQTHINYLNNRVDRLQELITDGLKENKKSFH